MAGRRRSGVESTIVACLDDADAAAAGRPAARRRSSACSAAPLADAPAATPTATTAPLAPGQLASHYAPRARLRLDARKTSSPARHCSPSAQLPAAVPTTPPRPQPVVRAAISIEAAANLFSHLRALDAAGAPRPSRSCRSRMTGLGEAINDRLARAAAARA